MAAKNAPGRSSAAAGDRTANRPAPVATAAARSCSANTFPPGPLRAGPADGASSAAVVTTNPAETGNPTADREDDADALPPTAPGGGVAEMGNGMSSLTRVTVPGQMLRCGFQAIRGALQARQRLPG